MHRKTDQGGNGRDDVPESDWNFSNRPDGRLGRSLLVFQRRTIRVYRGRLRTPAYQHEKHDPRHSQTGHTWHKSALSHLFSETA